MVWLERWQMAVMLAAQPCSTLLTLNVASELKLLLGLNQCVQLNGTS